MCGIAGIISSKPSYRSSIKKMTDIISYRGPDGEGAYTWNDVALGHRRLSIIDVSNLGCQPMSYLEKYVIIFNGEIYNYIELKEELLQHGYQFSSHTDTEVLLAAYDHWGTNCLHQFNGMFSFALLDKEKNTLFCARDRFGIKPFYYYERPGFFAFASEIKVFTILEGWKAIGNKERIYEYLQFGIQDHTEETMFEEVFQLKGGHSLSIDLKTREKKIERWYSLSDTSASDDKTAPAQKFNSLFNSSIKLRLRADVKVGSCLSGGLDSSSVVLTVHEHLKKLNKVALQETVSSCFENKKYDEQQYIDEVVKKADCINHKIFPDLSQLYAQLSKIVWHQDEPFGSTSIFAQWEVFKKAREENITVMLDGQGADEILAGYHSYYGVYFWELIKKGRFKTLRSEIEGLQKLGLYKNGFLSKEVIKNAVPLTFWLLLKKLGRQEKGYINHNYLSTRTASENISHDSVAAMSLTQVERSNLPMLLHYEDRDSMAFSIEARVPFLDYRLVEYLFHLNAGQKINNGITKWVLREAMKDLLPEKVLNRKDKMGFVTPEEVWMKENTFPLRNDLQSAIETTNGFINQNILEKFDKMMSGKIPFDFSIWRVLCFAEWVRVFEVKL